MLGYESKAKGGELKRKLMRLGIASKECDLIKPKEILFIGKA